jgi:twitching motility protein PilU
MDIHALLKRLVDFDGSDLYLSTGAPPSARFAGELTALSDVVFAPGEVEAIAQQIMNAEQCQEFDRELEMNLAISPAGIGRFRINIFKQRNEVSLVARNIQTEIPRFDDLGLPEILKDVITAKNGLVLFVGGTGSGKSTSLAALIDHRNSAKGGHIVTIEDPVEYVHPHKKCIVNQREVGVDTLSFHAALKNTLRQAPDVILIGEIRDRETMEHAMVFAETGHLAISTLHANNANQALDRIVNFFPEERKAQLLHDLGNNIRAIVSQRLIPTLDGKRCAAIEILLGSHTIKQMIMKDQLVDIKEVMQKSESQGMKTFDSALFDLVREGRISQAEALKNADSVNNLRLRFKLSGPINQDNLLLHGQLPSQVAAARAAAETTIRDSATREAAAEHSAHKDAGAEDARTSGKADTALDVHAAMAAQISQHKAMNASDNGGGARGGEDQKALSRFKPALQQDPDPAPVSSAADSPGRDHGVEHPADPAQRIANAKSMLARHRAQAARLRSLKQANGAGNGRDTTTARGLQAVPHARELSLQVDPEPESAAEEDDQQGVRAFGMGRNG